MALTKAHNRMIAYSTFNVKDFGAIGDGVTNDSAAFIAATNAAFANGGGVVEVPVGTYEIEGIELKEGVSYWGRNQFSTILRLPLSPSAHMFSADTAATFEGGGFHGLQLDGRGTTTYDAIDFSAVDRLEEYVVDLCKIHRFRRGFNGSFGSVLGNDRYPVLRHTRFWDNVVGVFTNEHAILDTLDIRENDVGLDGRINDIYATGCKFVRNGVGAGKNGTITNSWFNGCFWYLNTEAAAYLDDRVSVFGGRADGTNSGDVGFVVRGQNVDISHVQFAQTAGLAFGLGCIRLDAVTSIRTTISGNLFNLLSGGPAVFGGPSNTAAIGLTLIGNEFQVIGRKALALTGSLQRGIITDNRLVTSAALPAGEAFFEWLGGSNLRPPVITGNHVAGQALMATGHGFKGDLSEATIGMNQFLNFTASVGAIATTAGTLKNVRWGQNGTFRTRNTGFQALGAAATSVTVTHGVSRVIQIGREHVQVSPTTDIGSATKFWISNVTDTTFDINVDIAPGATIEFSWQVLVS